jgi:hypothetical protein
MTVSMCIAFSSILTISIFAICISSGLSIRATLRHSGQDNKSGSLTHGCLPLLYWSRITGVRRLQSAIVPVKPAPDSVVQLRPFPSAPIRDECPAAPDGYRLFPYAIEIVRYGLS